MDPGETVKLIVSVKNEGIDMAPNVNGILKCNDPYITIPDSVGTFGIIDIDSTRANTVDFFQVAISSSCPVDYSSDFSLVLSTQGGNYPYKKTVTFSMPVGKPDSLDPTGPDTYGYYAYSSDDILYQQSPVYNWVEIENIGTEINIPNSEYTTTVNIPFNFKYYGTNFNQVRISTDGWIAFGSGSQVAYSNNSLPSNDAIASMVAIFWDDLVDNNAPSSQINQIFYYNDATNHRFIIEWDSLAHWGNGTSPKYEVFQIILNDPAYYSNPPTGDGEIIFQYKKTSVTNSCTVGIENNNQNGALSYVYNNDYQTTASVLKNSFAIKFTTEPPTLVIVSEPEVSDGLNKSGLDKVFPNPFDNSTTIYYSLPEQSVVSLKIYDINGRLIKILYEGLQPEGNYSIAWNGKDDAGNQTSAGMYLVKLSTDTFNQTMKLCRIKYEK